MHKAILRIKFILLFFILTPSLTFAAASKNGADYSAETAQPVSPPTSGEPEMADLLRSNGMIYVVVGVILIVLIGLILYLVSLDRKIGKLEKEMEGKE